MDLGICLSTTSSVWVEIFIDGENSFNFLKTAAMEHYMSLFYLIYKYWSHKYWLKLGNENKKICKHVNLEKPISTTTTTTTKTNFEDKENERIRSIRIHVVRSMWINVLLMVSASYLQ